MLSINKKNNQHKSVDLVLIMCPAWGVVQPPISISYLKGFLEKGGIRVKCFDFSLELYKVFPEKKYWDLNYPEHFISQQLFDKDILPILMPFISVWGERILQCNPRAVGFSLFMSTINISAILAKYLRAVKPDLIIIGGGPEVTRLKKIIIEGNKRIATINKEVMAHGLFDVFIDGEGEKTLSEIVLEDDLAIIDGIMYYNEYNKIVVNRNRVLIPDLDILPPPDYHDFELNDYTKKSLPIITSRGCINRCTFCADSPLWKKYRYSSPEKVVSDIKCMNRRYGRNEFEVVDSIFNGDLKRVAIICDLIIINKLNIYWSAKMSLRKEMDRGFFERMRRAGCTSVAYGIESGSQKVLDDMRKNIDINEVKRIIKDTWKAGIQANCFFLIGYPTETEEDFQMSLDFIRENSEFIHSFDQVTGCHIEEDSYLGLNLDKNGIILRTDGWHSQHSTPEVRRERLNRFRELARTLHKHYQCEVQQ
ncbi:MAG TPA: hypothetical protein DCE80_06680 [Ignavibacteriales bacterium]|nr:hypothetical protein [Ignavibacteriales bacterium]